jgi:excisionase family DNA binding protein
MRSKWQQAADSAIAPSAASVHDQQDAPDPWIGIQEAARYLAVPIRTMYLLAQRKQVPAVKVGRAWRFKRSVLDDRLRDADEVQTATALADVSVELGGLSDPDAIARFVSDRLREIFGVEMAGFMRLEDDALVTVLPSERLGLPAGVRFPLASSAILQAAMENQEPTVFYDLSASSAPPSDIVSRFKIRGAVFVPIRVGRMAWGLLSLATLTPRHFSPKQMDRLLSIASQTGLALNNARLLAETRRWSEHLERIEALPRSSAGLEQ